jgi:hypothetical protein
MMLVMTTIVQAQWRVGKDSASRWTAFGRAVVTGTGEAVLFSAIDQWRDEPSEWSQDWNGYGKRLASNEAGFLIQEGITEGLAAAMRRPIFYEKCKCTGPTARVGWAIRTAVTDPMPNGSTPLAVPRIAGAYVGSFAQATWRPGSGGNRVGNALWRGTSSLALGALNTMVHVFWWLGGVGCGGLPAPLRRETRH